MSYIIPSDTHVPGDPNCTPDLDNAWDMLGLLTRTLALLAGNAQPTPGSNAANVATVQALTLQAVINTLTGTQASGQYLRSNGTNAALSAIRAADLPAATTSAQGAVELDGTATDIQPLGTQAAGSTGKAADAGHVHPSSGAGMTNPMTTLGDVIYENSTPAAARLAGNTSATKNFLTQTGTGSASAAPAWGTITSGDIPTLNQNTTGTAANITDTLDQVPAPAANVAMNSKKLTGLANGSAATDSATYGQLLTTPPYYYMMPAGAIAETFPRLAAAASEALVTLTLDLSAIVLAAGTVVTNITFVIGGTAASGQTHWWYGLYDSNFNQLALTADQTTTAAAASTAYTLGVATGSGGSITTYTIATTGLYYLGWMMQATTMPTLLRMAGAGLAGIAAVNPILAGTSDVLGTGTPPSFPHTATAITKANAAASKYAYVS